MTSTINRDRSRGLWRCLLVYLAALLGAAITVRALPEATPLVRAGTADIAATLIVFLFSRVMNNSSYYDPYWSVVPPILALYWLWSLGAITVRTVLVAALVFWWSVRLTANWIRRWNGIGDEDWRYVYLKSKAGWAGWIIDLFGIQLFPTAQVFVASFSIYLVMSSGALASPLGATELAALLVTVGAIVLEWVADRQLSRFRAANSESEVLNTGVWRMIRHPNYLGEILFWWGLWLFAIASAPTAWWSILGPLTMSALFVFISVPMMDRHLVELRPGYLEHKNSTAALLPRVY